VVSVDSDVESGEKDESLSAVTDNINGRLSENSDDDKKVAEQYDGKNARPNIKGRRRQQTPSIHSSAASSGDSVFGQGGIVDTAHGTTTGPRYEDV